MVVMNIERNVFIDFKKDIRIHKPSRFIYIREGFIHWELYVMRHGKVNFFRNFKCQFEVRI